MPNTIESQLKQAIILLSPGSASASLDAEVLLCHCLNKARTFLRTWPKKQLDLEQIEHFHILIQQRILGTPIAYLTGQREFWSRTFTVTPDVLIPRPDSELLIELCLSHIPQKQVFKIIDLGAGSGILAVTLGLERPSTHVFAADISVNALRVAKQNAEQLSAKNVHFIHSSWFDSITIHDFDIVVSNPPYIAENDPHLRQGDLRFEPLTALISQENGLQDVRLIAEQARLHLKPDGLLMLEHGFDQHLQVQTIFKNLNYQKITTYQDLSGNYRVTSGIWNPL